MTPRRWQHAAVLVEDRQLDPGVVGAVAGRPDDGVDLELACRRRSAPCGPRRRRPRLERDAVRACVSSRGLEPISVSRVLERGGPGASRRSCRAGPACVSHQKRSRPSSRCGSGVWREPTRGARPCASPRAPWRSGSRCCRRRPRGRCRRARARAGGSRRCASGRRRVQLVGQRRHVRDAGTARWRRRPGRPRAPPSASVDDEAPVVLGLERSTRLSNWTGRSNVSRVLLEVGDHLVAGRVAVGIAGKRQAGKRVIAARREQHQRVPALAPRGADRLARSRITNRRPARARKWPIASPAWPAPMTATSTRRRCETVLRAGGEPHSSPHSRSRRRALQTSRANT